MTGKPANRFQARAQLILSQTVGQLTEALISDHRWSLVDLRGEFSRKRLCTMRRSTFSHRRKFIEAVLAAGLPVKTVTMAADGSMQAIASLDKANFNDRHNSSDDP